MAALTSDIDVPFSLSLPLLILKKANHFSLNAFAILSKKVSNPKSFDHAVTAAGRLAKDMADIVSLFSIFVSTY